MIWSHTPKIIQSPSDFSNECTHGLPNEAH